MGALDQALPVGRRRPWISRAQCNQLLIHCNVIWALVLAVTVALMFAFDRNALVDADRIALSWQNHRAVHPDEVDELYDSTLRLFDAPGGAECYRPRERSCLDGFCMAGHWKDNPSPCKGDLGGGLPSYELFERTTTAASALGAAVAGGLVNYVVLALGVGDDALPRFVKIAAPALAIPLAAGLYGTVAFFRAVEAAVAVAFPHPAAPLMARTHFAAVRNGVALTSTALALGAALLSKLLPGAVDAADDVTVEYEVPAR